MAHTIRSIDNLINSIPEAQPIIPAGNKEVVAPTEIKSAPVTPETDYQDDDFVEAPSNIENPALKSDKSTENTLKADNVQQNDVKSSENATTPKTETDVDEYGNPVAKPKTYTEDQVQQMIRDRLKRGSFNQNQQPTPQQVQQATETGFEYNENSNLTWAQQMKQFIGQTINEIGQEQHEKQVQHAQHQAQVEFESKFYSGMEKYDDFVPTLETQPVTNDMMKAIRGLKNPAALLYAAAKRMPGELDRISKIMDPFQQAAEMGALHAKLSKPRRSSNAPQPLSQDKGDINDKAPAKVSIDHLIAEDANKKFRR